MQIAKPPGGFNVIEPDAVKALIRSHQVRWPRLEAYGADIKERLKQTGRREGAPCSMDAWRSPFCSRRR